jgi:ubiquinone/menaquinone biosynthesis C-methylase UbiE
VRQTGEERGSIVDRYPRLSLTVPGERRRPTAAPRGNGITSGLARPATARYRRNIMTSNASDSDPHCPFYGGPTLHVRSYDSINNDDRAVILGDTGFYLDLAHRVGGEVLEVGVGTGRVALALAEAGVSVTGIDASPAMLAIAVAKAATGRLAERLHFELADMRAFDFPARRFGLAIVPFRAFQLLLTVDDQLAALTGILRHLRPGGIVAVHLFDPDLRFLLPGSTTAPVERQIGIDRETGRRIEAELEATSFDHVMQVRRDLWRYRAFDADGTVVEEETLELPIRWIFRWEMRHLLQIAGFVVEAEYSDFTGSPPQYGKEQIWVARARQ